MSFGDIEPGALILGVAALWGRLEHRLTELEVLLKQKDARVDRLEARLAVLEHQSDPSSSA